jgi:hypothetical protein
MTEKPSFLLPSGLDLSSSTNCPSALGAEAQSVAFEPPDENTLILGRFTDQRKVVDGRRLHFEGPDGKTVTVAAASLSRYAPSGRAKIKRKLAKRLAKQRVPGVMTTLTVDPKRFSKREAWESIWREYASFRRRLWKYLDHQGRTHSPMYVAVLEQHKSGYPHMHVAYPGLRYLAPKEIINSAWRMGTTHVEGGRRGVREVTVSPLGYVLKYISKLSGWTEGGLAHLWHARARLYNLSRRLYVVPKDPPVPGWKLTKIDYVTEYARDLARRVACLRYIARPRRPGAVLTL